MIWIKLPADRRKMDLVMVIAAIYGAMIFVTAWLTGRRDGKENFLFDAGFRWNLTTFIAWGIASEAWFFILSSFSF